MAALVGGGLKVKPGEVSLAHLGVLFLDELPEFQRGVLDSLRQPIETGEAVVARANAHVRYPARFQLVAAMNPCRCGYLSDPAQACGRAPKCAGDYQSRISGPLFDRIDMHVEVRGRARPAICPCRRRPKAAPRWRRGWPRRATSSASALRPVRIRTNAEAEGELLDRDRHAGCGGRQASDRSGGAHAAVGARLSPGAAVARTIADLAGAPQILRPHIAEALSYRRLSLQS